MFMNHIKKNCESRRQCVIPSTSDSKLVIQDDKIFVSSQGGPSTVATKLLGKINKMLKSADQPELDHLDQLEIELKRIRKSGAHPLTHDLRTRKNTIQPIVYNVKREKCPENFSYILNKNKTDEKTIHPAFRTVAHRVNRGSKAQGTARKN